MANKTKKEATSAIAQLKRYLRNDKPGMAMLESIQRYLGELRQGRSKMIDEMKELKAQADESRARALSAFGEVTLLRASLNAAQSLLNQVSNDRSLLQEQVAKLEKELEPPDTKMGDVPKRFQGDMQKTNDLFKELHRMMKKAPTPLMKSEYSRIFDIGDIIQGWDHNNIYKLGLFVFFCASCGCSAGFNMEQFHQTKVGTTVRGLNVKHFWVFICDWLGGDEKWKRDILLRTDPYYYKWAPTDPKKTSTKVQQGND